MEVEAFAGGSMSGVRVGNEGDNSHFLRHARDFTEYLATKDLTPEEALTVQQMEELIQQKKEEAERKTITPRRNRHKRSFNQQTGVTGLSFIH